MTDLADRLETIECGYAYGCDAVPLCREAAARIRGLEHDLSVLNQSLRLMMLEEALAGFRSENARDRWEYEARQLLDSLHDEVGAEAGRE